jgi:hypothetical protein
MNRYLALVKGEPLAIFLAENDQAAEKHVEQQYTEDDGHIVLYRLAATCEWGNPQ